VDATVQAPDFPGFARGIAASSVVRGRVLSDQVRTSVRVGAAASEHAVNGMRYLTIFTLACRW